MTLLRLTLHYVGLCHLLIIAAIAAAVGGGHTRPDVPPFAYFYERALYLYDPHTQTHLTLSRGQQPGPSRWYEDGGGIAANIAVDGSWAVFEFGSGWHYQQSAPSRLTRDIAPPFPPPGMSLLLTRQSGGQTWNVSLVDDTTREETPLRPLQNLTDVPHLFWSGDGERLLVFAPARNITPLLLIDIDTQHTDYLTAFPPGTTYGSPSFSSGGVWLSLILHPPAPPSALYIVNTTTGQVQLVRQNVPGTAIVGFRPHTN